MEGAAAVIMCRINDGCNNSGGGGEGRQVVFIGGGCRVGGGSSVTTIDGATKLAGGIGGDVRRSSVAF